MANLLRGVPTQYEPKLKNRFIVQFPQELDIPAWLVQTIGRPTIDIEGATIEYLNTESYVRTRYKFGTIDIKFIDPIGPSTSQKLMEWVRLHAEPLTGRMGYAAGYSKDLILSTLDPTGVVIEAWKLFECQITKVEFDEFDHAAGELIKPMVTLQPRYCEMMY